ncbi:DUF2567 domain-containing protein [Mycobacterium uberis]|uniref:DUF2567 domain-containing protein n=1 Tax=Mycobacterium uberis TaxID=2162698 RepID=A0A3E1HLH2_9MYCO|nr:DUF2567 domain-containing protein [Mycobacterium uberis]RFD27288.1 DUF2567 domain-containing protein [Mycobacterium uberis]
MTEHCAPDISEVFRPPRVRVIVRVVLGLAVTGVLIGGLWAWIAPPIHVVAAFTRTGERVHNYLGDESEHFFVAPCLMLGVLTVVAVMTSVLVWQWREYRGPGMVTGLAIGSMACVATATTVGALLVWMRYGAVNFDALLLSDDQKVAHVVQAPPVFFAHGPLQVAATVLWPTGIAALVYAALAAANGHDDLGSQPVVNKSSKVVSIVEPEASVP